MESGVSRALGFGILAVVIVSAAIVLLYTKIPVKDSGDMSVLAIAVAASMGVLVFIYMRIKKNDEAIKELLDQRSASLNITDCPDYYTRSDTGQGPVQCTGEFNGKRIGPSSGDLDSVNLTMIRGETRDKQCADDKFTFDRDSAKYNRVWTHLKNECS